jgi:hypothetical protein
MNLLQNAQGSVKSNASAWDMMTSYQSANEAESGQLGVINSLTVNHNLDRADAGVIERAPNTILPKHIELNLEFSPIHEGPLGWKDEKSQNELFPYGVSLFSGEMKKDQQGNPIIAAATPPAADDDEFEGWGPGSGTPGPGDGLKPDQSPNSAIRDTADMFAAMAVVREQNRGENTGHAMKDVWDTHGGSAGEGSAGKKIRGGSGARGTMAPVMDVDFGGGG